MRILFLLLTTLLFARENPFIPVVTNENNNEKEKGKTIPQKRKPPVSGHCWTNDTKKHLN